jgi:hypothetical protein
MAPVMCPIIEALDVATVDQGQIIWIDESIPLDDQPSFGITRQHTIFSTICQAQNLETQINIDWFIAIYPNPPANTYGHDLCLQDWLSDIREHIIVLLHHTMCRAMLIMVPHKIFPRHVFKKLQQSLPLSSHWATHNGLIENTKHGGAMETSHDFILIAEEETCCHFIIPESTAIRPQEMETVVDKDQLPIFDLRDFNVILPTVHDLAMNQTPHAAQICNRVKHRAQVEPTFGWTVSDTTGPGPSIQLPRAEEQYFSAWFVTSPGISSRDPFCYKITTISVLKLLGLTQEHAETVLCLNPTQLHDGVRASPGVQGLGVLFTALYFAELQGNPFDTRKVHTASDKQEYIPAFVNAPRDDSSTIPIPTDQEWFAAINEDHDLALILQNQDNLNDIPQHNFLDKIYFQLIHQNQIEVTEHVIYYFERSKSARVRQVKVRIVPLKLRRIVIAACHSSPFGGHSGITRTLYRVQTRYWWPGMYRDIHDGVRGCAHCNLANAASHESQLLIHTLSCDEPFDVIHLDLWSPGDICDKDGNIKVLTCLDSMTGFAMAAFLQGEISAYKVANAIVSTLFVSVGLPRLIVVDAEGVFAGVFVQLFQLLQVPVYTVSRENHQAILNERFHRYLNKVQRINSADMGELLKWKQGVCFSLYGSNAAPIDGTDISRSKVAVGREFPFPIDLSNQTNVPRLSGSSPQNAIDYFDAASPLLYQQRELLRILNDERRERHRDLRNKGKQEREFSPGNLVIVRKQVQSNASKGISAKLLFKTKGPYRVIDKVSPNSYHLQKLPFLKGLGRKGRIVKQKVSRMSLLPSTLILHKKADGMDTRFAQMEAELSTTPLAPWLGVLKHGAYTKAADDDNWAFEPLASMWSEPLDDDESSDGVSTESDEESIYDDMDFPVDTQDSEDDEDKGAKLPHKVIPVVTKQVNDVTSRTLRQFYKKVQDSQDKLFFVVWQPKESHSVSELRLAQVVWDECDPLSTREHGLYVVRWWSPRPRDQDSLNRSLVDCQFWPELRLIQADGATGNKFMCRPDKVKVVLQDTDTKVWPTYVVPLVEIRIVGPFDFSQCRFTMQGPKNQARSEPYHVAPIYWEQLEQRAPLFDLDVSHIQSST